MIDPGLIKILVIEEDSSDLFMLEDFLKTAGFHKENIFVAAGWEKAQLVLKTTRLSVVLLDLNTSCEIACETFLKLQQSSPGLPIVVISDYRNRHAAADTIKKGAQDFLVKGEFNAPLLGKAIQYAIERCAYISELWKKEEEYKYLFDSNPSPLLIWDTESLNITRVNHAAITFYGYTQEEFSSRRITDIFDPVELEVNGTLLLKEIKSGHRLFSSKHKRVAGYSCFVDMVMKDILLHGRPARIMLVNDVTEKHIAMERLVQSEQQLRKLADNYPNGTIAILDSKFYFNFIDGKDLDHHNLDPEKLTGKKYTDFLDEINREKFNTRMIPVFQGQQVVFDIHFKDETYLVSAAGLVNARGIIDKVILVSQNITGNILANKEILFQSEILNNVNDALVVKDLEGRIIYCNAGSTRLFGYSAEEMTGKLLNDFISDGNPVNNYQQIKDKVFAHGTFNFESEVTDSKGNRVSIETKQTLMCDDEGKPAYIVGISHDIANRIKAEQVLKESEANLQAIFQSTSQTFLLMDCDTRIIAFNRNASNAVQAFYNKTLKKGDSYRTFLLKDREQQFEKNLNEVLQKKMVRFEERFDFPGRKEVFMEVTYSPVMKDDEVIAIIICAEDTTEKALYKETILKSEQKYRELVETSIDIIWTIDETGTLVFANEAAFAIMGWEPAMLIGQNFLNFVAPADKERVAQHIKEALENVSHHNNYESTIIRKDGTEINVITHAVVNIDSKSGRRWLTGTSRDITQRFLAEKELNEKNTQLRMLSSYLQTVREDERTHIAREIHDELGQQLTGLKMDLAWLNRKLGADQAEHKNKLVEMMKLVDDTVKSVRKISSDLRPGILDDLGLIPAIEWQCNEFEKRTHIPCTFTTRVPDIMISKEVSTGVFRIFQESLTNIARHANASRVQVELESTNNNFRLNIIDNGKGFLQDGSVAKKTLGLVGMKERAGMLNGHLSINSRPNEGTHVTLDFPQEQEIIES